ncbi:hypothetical protein L596_030767 [Steinernema carpocapsae]|uniref:Uncharacterized protein n=1 Tax=Steinernema carpocapsae TaxID=34508 RepID=A0A4U5LNS2_STECR|nr:hypothetical protein L596_030767 [Steinernema carpocapsae]
MPNELFVGAKLTETFEFKFFDDGEWLSAGDLRTSATFLDAVFDKCIKNSKRCLDYSKPTAAEEEEEPQLKTYAPGNGFFLECPECQKNQRVLWFQHTWDGLTINCVNKYGSVGGCAKKLNPKMQESFKCTMLSERDYMLIEPEFKSVLYPFRKDGKLETDDDAHYVFPETKNKRFKVWDITHQGLPAMVVFSPPVYIENDNKRELQKLTTYLEDVAEFLAMKLGLIVMSKSPVLETWTDEEMGGRTDWGQSSIGAVDVKLSVSAHFVPEHRNEATAWFNDNTRMLYTVPLNTSSYNDYWVCTMDSARNIYEMFRGQAVFCWHDRALNQNLRCNSVIRMMIASKIVNGRRVSGPYEKMEEKLQEFYADCPVNANLWRYTKESLRLDGLFYDSGYEMKYTRGPEYL